MDELLLSHEFFKLLGFSDDKTCLEHGDVTRACLYRYPARTARLAAALAARFQDDMIDVVVGLSLDAACLGFGVAQNLCQYAGNGCGVVGFVPLWPNPFKEGTITVDSDDARFLEMKRVLVVVQEASRVIPVNRLTEFCRASGAAWISVALIANFGCDPSSLGLSEGRGEKIRSLTDYPSV